MIVYNDRSKNVAISYKDNRVLKQPSLKE